MDRYWFRIVAGALAIFGIGMLGFAAVRRGKAKVNDFVNSDHPFTIPLGGALPFTFDGKDLGRLQSVTIERSSPKELHDVKLAVHIADSVSDATIPTCDLFAAKLDLGEHTTFTCAPADVATQAGFASFGQVVISHANNETTKTLYGDTAAVALFRRERVWDNKGNGRQHVDFSNGGANIDVVDGKDAVKMTADSNGLHIVVKDSDGDNSNIEIGPKGVVIEGSGNDAVDTVAAQYARVKMEAAAARKAHNRRLADKLDATADRLKETLGRVAATN